MKKISHVSKRTKLMIHREVIAQLSSKQFARIAGGADRSGEGNAINTSDVIGCGNTSENYSECC